MDISSTSVVHELSDTGTSRVLAEHVGDLGHQAERNRTGDNRRGRSRNKPKTLSTCSAKNTGDIEIHIVEIETEVVVAHRVEQLAHGRRRGALASSSPYTWRSYDRRLLPAGF